MKIRDFLIGVGAAVDIASFDKAQGSMNSLKTVAYGVSGALAGIGAGVWYLKSIVDEASNAGDATAKLARNLGLSAEALQEWQHIAGLENFDVSTAFKFLAKNMAEAKDGVKTSLDAFNRLNVSVTNADGTLRSYDDVLMDVAENFPKLSEAERVQTAMDIFGRSGLTMVGTMMKGKDAIKAMRQEAQDMGIVLSGETLEQMEEYNDMNLRLDESILGVKMQLSRALIPSMIELAKSAKDKVVPIIKWMRDNQEQLKATLKTVGTMFLWVAGTMALWGIGAMTLKIGSLISALALMGKTGMLAWVKMLLIPLLVAGAVALIILIIQDVYKTLTDPTAFTLSRLLWNEWSGYVIGKIKAVNNEYEGFYDTIGKLSTFIIGIGQQIVGILGMIGNSPFALTKALFGQKDAGFEYAKNLFKYGTENMNLATKDIDFAPPTIAPDYGSAPSSIAGRLQSRTTNIETINITEPVDVNKFKSFIEDDFSTFIQSMETN
jgi:hypothetical protein